jgi:DTW domain-containing protein YfiP
MRSHTPRTLEGICPRCFLKLELCLCTGLPRIQTEIEIIIIRHVTEEWLTSNTARLAALMLTNVRILRYGGGEPFDAGLLRSSDALLLTPDANPAPCSAAPQQLILLDGTFRQARRMYKKIPALHDLNRCALLSSSGRLPGLRRPPRENGLSTIEAIACALAQFESEQVSTPLLAAYSEFVRRANLARGRTQLPRQRPAGADGDGSLAIKRIGEVAQS